MCPGLQGFHAKPWHHQRAAVGQELHLSQAQCHGGGFDLWSVDKQDKRSPSANLYASLPSLYQRRRHLLPLQGCGVLPYLATTKTADSWPILCLASHTIALHLSLGLLLCPWQTLVITARSADRSPGWVSALATVGTGGKMEGVEGGKDRRIIWGRLPKAPLLVSWHQKWWFRWWHRMITQHLVFSLYHLQITKIKSYRNITRPTLGAIQKWHFSFNMGVYTM